MKKSLIYLSLGLGLLPVFSVAQTPVNANAAELQMLEGPGPVMAGSVNYSKLPEKARKFITDNFKDAKVVNVEKEFTENRYDVTLDNGVELDFNQAGELIEIDGQDAPLPYSIVKKILPEAAATTLESNAVHNSVKSIDVEGTIFDVEFVKMQTINIKEMKFDSTGKTMSIKNR